MKLFALIGLLCVAGCASGDLDQACKDKYVEGTEAFNQCVLMEKLRSENIPR